MDERVALKIQTIWPFDKSSEEVREFYLNRKRELDRAYRRERRAIEKARNTHARDLSVRQELLVVILGGETWQTTNDIVRQVARHHAWRDHTGKRISRESLRRLVNRALKSLKSDGYVEGQCGVGSRGQAKYRYRALPRPAQREERRSEADAARDGATP